MEKMMDLTPVVMIVLSGVLTYLIGRLLHFMHTKMDEEQQALLQTWVHIAVYAAEKLYGAGHGREKLSYVQELLETKGFTLDIELLEAMVNAEIQEMETALAASDSGKVGHSVYAGLSDNDN